MTKEEIKQIGIIRLHYEVDDFLERMKNWKLFKSHLDRDDTISVTARDYRDKSGKIWIHKIFFIVYTWKEDEKTKEYVMNWCKIRSLEWRYDREEYIKEHKEEGDNAIE